MNLCTLIITALLLFFTAGPVSADLKEFRWTQDLSQPVQGWTLHLGFSSGNYDEALTQTYTSIALLPGADGIYRVEVDLTPDTPYYVAVQAFNVGGTSPFSNERIFTLGSPGGDNLPGAPINVR